MPPAGFVLPRITIPISLPQVYDTPKRGLLNSRDVPFDKTTSGLLLLKKKTNQRRIRQTFFKELKKGCKLLRRDNLKKSLNV